MSHSDEFTLPAGHVAVDFHVPTPEGYKSLGHYIDHQHARFWTYSYIPRVGDSLDIDGAYYTVLAVLGDYKDQSYFAVYLKPLGTYTDFLESLPS